MFLLLTGTISIFVALLLALSRCFLANLRARASAALNFGGMGFEGVLSLRVTLERLTEGKKSPRFAVASDRLRHRETCRLLPLTNSIY